MTGASLATRTRTPDAGGGIVIKHSPSASVAFARMKDPDTLQRLVVRSSYNSPVATAATNKRISLSGGRVARKVITGVEIEESKAAVKPRENKTGDDGSSDGSSDDRSPLSASQRETEAFIARARKLLRSTEKAESKSKSLRQKPSRPRAQRAMSATAPVRRSLRSSSSSESLPPVPGALPKNPKNPRRAWELDAGEQPDRNRKEAIVVPSKNVPSQGSNLKGNTRRIAQPKPPSPKEKKGKSQTREPTRPPKGKQKGKRGPKSKATRRSKKGNARRVRLPKPKPKDSSDSSSSSDG